MRKTSATGDDGGHAVTCRAHCLHLVASGDLVALASLAPGLVAASVLDDEVLCHEISRRLVSGSLTQSIRGAPHNATNVEANLWYNSLDGQPKASKVPWDFVLSHTLYSNAVHIAAATGHVQVLGHLLSLGTVADELLARADALGQVIETAFVTF